MGSIDEPANARSRRTRDALLEAARTILETDGFPALTMSAVAARAGVSRRGLYLHFDNVGELIAELFDHVASAEELEHSTSAVWQAPDAAAALQAWAHHLADYHPRLIALDHAIRAVERDEPAAAAHRARVDQAQRDNCNRLAARLHEEERLANGWTLDTAADMLFGLISTDLIDRLHHTCRWDQQQLADQLALLFTNTFLALSPTPLDPDPSAS